MSKTITSKVNTETQTLTTFSIEQLRETVKGSDLEHVQLSGGPFRGYLLHGRFGDSLMDTGIYSHDLLVHGTLPSDRVTLGYILKGNRAGFFNGVQFATHDIVVVGEGGVMEPYILPAGTQWVGIQTQRGVLEQAEVPLPTQGSSVVYSGRSNESPKLGRRIRAILASALRDEPFDSGGITGSGLVLEDEVMTAFRHAIDTSRDAAFYSYKPSYNRRSQMLRLIEEFVENNLTSEIRIPDLCARINISQRTLEYLFEDHYGMPPRQYLITRRLNAVRQCLQRPQSRDESIASIAARFQFKHPGRFAQTYLKLFGELPSATRRP